MSPYFLTDVEVEKIGRDPFLIGYGLSDIKGRTIVTTEVSRPKAIRANRPIPDVCKQFDIACVDTFAFVRALDFRTSWKKSSLIGLPRPNCPPAGPLPGIGIMPAC